MCVCAQGRVKQPVLSVGLSVYPVKLFTGWNILQYSFKILFHKYSCLIGTLNVQNMYENLNHGNWYRSMSCMVTHLELNKSPVHAHAQTEKLEVCLIKDGIHLSCIGPSVY